MIPAWRGLSCQWGRPDDLVKLQAAVRAAARLIVETDATEMVSGNDSDYSWLAVPRTVTKDSYALS